MQTMVQWKRVLVVTVAGAVALTVVPAGGEMLAQARDRNTGKLIKIIVEQIQKKKNKKKHEPAPGPTKKTDPPGPSPSVKKTNPVGPQPGPSPKEPVIPDPDDEHVQVGRCIRGAPKQCVPEKGHSVCSDDCVEVLGKHPLRKAKQFADLCQQHFRYVGRVSDGRACASLEPRRYGSGSCACDWNGMLLQYTYGYAWAGESAKRHCEQQLPCRGAYTPSGAVALGSCTLGPRRDLCTEMFAAAVAKEQARSSCNAAQGAYSEQACRKGFYASCTETYANGSRSISRYYPGFPPEVASKTCTLSKGQYTVGDGP